MVEVKPTLPEVRRKVVNMCPKTDQCWQNSGENWSRFGRQWPRFGRSWTWFGQSLADTGPDSAHVAKFGRCRPRSRAHDGTNVVKPAKFGRSRTEFGQNRNKLGRTQPSLAESGLLSVELGQILAFSFASCCKTKAHQICQTLARICRFRAKLGRPTINRQWPAALHRASRQIVPLRPMLLTTAPASASPRHRT